MNKQSLICKKCLSLNSIPDPVPEGKTAKCGHCKESLAPYTGGAVDVTPVAFANLIQHSPIPLVVDCWADWCQPCKAFAPTFSSVAIEKARQALFLKLDTQTHQQLAGQLNIRSIPTLLIFNEGKEIIRQSGALPRDQFLHWLKKSGI